MGVAAGVVLLQKSREMWNYQSVTFQRNSVTVNAATVQFEKESLSLVVALRHFEVYLGANPFPVKCIQNHNPLVFLSRMQNLKSTFDALVIGHSKNIILRLFTNVAQRWFWLMRCPEQLVLKNAMCNRRDKISLSLPWVGRKCYILCFI